MKSDSANSLPILMYHSIPEHGPAKSGMQVRLSAMRRQLIALQREGWSLVGLSEALYERKRASDRRYVAVTFDDGYADFLGAVDCLANIGARATLYISTNHVGDSGLIPEAGRLLDWDELAGLSPDVVEIASHAHTHAPVDVLSGNAISREATVSKAVIRERLGREATSFCYPHGYSSTRVRRRVARAGYTNACIVGRRVATSDDDAFALPRLHVRDEMSELEIHRLVNQGESGILPRVKPLLQPGWRAVRYASRSMGRELT